MKVLIGHRVKLAPTKEAAVFFSKCAGAVREVRNAALRQRSDYSRRGRFIGWKSQDAEIKDVRAAFDWVREVPQDIVAQSLRDLDAAFRKFFEGSSGYPRRRRRGVDDSFRFMARAGVSLGKGRLRLPKLGWVEARFSRPIQGELRSVTVSREGTGWWASILVLVDRKLPTWVPLKKTGIDLGAVNPIAEDDGTSHSIFGLTAGEEKRKKRLGQGIARCAKGSKNQRALRGQLADLESRGRRRRRHLTHEATSGIVRESGLISFEGHSVGNLTASAKGTLAEPGRNVAAKAGLNRAILNANPGEVRRQLAYKGKWLSRTVVSVDAAYTSQRCSSCGVHPLDADAPWSVELRGSFPHGRLSQSVFECPLCGYAENADMNAAKIIRRLGIDQAVTELRQTARPKGSGGKSKAQAKLDRERLASERAARRAEKATAREKRKAAKEAERELRAAARARNHREREKKVTGWFPGAKNSAVENAVAAPETSAVGMSKKREEEREPNNLRDRGGTGRPPSMVA